MSNLPPIHPGSRWDGDAVVGDNGNFVRFSGQCLVIGNTDIRSEALLIRHIDVLAVLRLAGLVPEVEELRRARERIAELEAKLDDEKTVANANLWAGVE